MGAVSPAKFIPVAEESGLMPRLTDFMLQTACTQLGEWHRLADDLQHLTMSVNVAGADISGGHLVERAAHAVTAAGIHAHHLTVELTEDILMEQLSDSMPTLEGLRALGVRLAVDDFGTGYSSLSHLTTLPIDSLKIDRSFVQKLARGSKEAAIIRAVVVLGHSLNKVVVAEGIENEAQFSELKRLGCDIAQGFLLARPLKADAVEALLVSNEFMAVAAAKGSHALLH
jgi:EAL domain-containing protein (putative c-di-GMP-specific phosphodiesterase class I)